MKKLTVLMVLAFAAIAFSQETRFSLRYGLDMGFMDMNPYEIQRYKADTNGMAGFQFGMTMDMCSDLFCIQPGFMLRQRGGENIFDNEGSHKVKDETKLWYLEWPLMLSLRIPFSEIAIMRVSAGPHIAFGLFGGIKRTVNDEEPGFSSAFSKSAFKRFDAGTNLGCGLDFESFYLGISYSLGLIDISQKKDWAGKVYNRSIGLILDYYL